MSFGANNRAQSQTDWVRVDTCYGESYTSASLNKKLAGVLPTGVYWGFEVVPATGMQVKVYPGTDPDYPKNVAVAERNGYSLTGTSEGELLVPVSAGFRGFLVLEMDYDHQVTRSAVRLVETAAEYHIVLAGLDIPQDAAEISADMISYDRRQVGNPAMIVSSFAGIVSALGRTMLEVETRVKFLEDWAKKQGYASPEIGG